MFDSFVKLFKNKREIFREIYEENFEAVYKFVYSRLGGRVDTVEDIVQDTFISAMKSLDHFKRKSSYRTWLCGIARHKVYDYYRKEMSDSTSDYKDEILVDDNYNLEEVVINNETRNMVLKVLNELKPDYRYILILKYIEGLSVREIGDIVKRTPKAVDGILQRAKVQFKREYFMIERDEFHGE